MGKNIVCDMCICEEENKDLKHLYDSVLQSNAEQIEILKDKIEKLEEDMK